MVHAALLRGSGNGAGGGGWRRRLFRVWRWLMFIGGLLSFAIATIGVAGGNGICHSIFLLGDLNGKLLSEV